MNRHLASRQIDEWLLGEPSPETEEHVRNCASCHAEVTRMREALLNFRQSVQEWSEERLPAHPETVWNDKSAPLWMRLPRLSLAFVVAALCILIAVTMTWRSERVLPIPLVTDAALLSEIDAEVSRTVPGPMEPLTEFVMLDSSSPEAVSRSAKNKARP